MSDPPPACRFVHATAPPPGAIAVIQLVGDTVPVLTAIAGAARWPVGRMRLTDLADIDTGLAGRLTENVAQLMPHGGPRVVQRLVARLAELGVAPLDPATEAPELLYPEARDRLEALAALALARAASPLAADLLLEQPDLWRTCPRLTDEDRARSRRLGRLVDPPTVVLAGRPNVGKSTLSNALLGRSMSIALDLPGTTRDYTTGRIDLAGLVVTWHDTPGLRVTGDAIEGRAIGLARRLLESADLVVALADPDHDWPELPRPPELRVASKRDLGARADADLALSALTGAGVPDLAHAVRDLLVPPEDLAHPGPWLFDARLERGTPKR